MSGDNNRTPELPPLHSAVVNGDIEMIEMLLDKGADANAQDATGCVPLFYAIEHTNLRTFDILLKRDADVNASNEDGQTALHLLACAPDSFFTDDNDDDFIDDEHREINLRKLFGDADDDIIGKHRAKISKFLLNRGANVNAQDIYRLINTPLHYAIERNDVDLVETLLEYNADVHSKKENLSPLHLAARNGNEIIIKMLLGNGADINFINEYKETALHTASSNGKEQAVITLLEHGADINVIDMSNDTALHRASYMGHEQTVITLLELGADINIINKNKETALHKAARISNYEIVDILLKYGAQIDSQDASGNTAIHTASWKWSEETVKTLLEHGADINIISNRNKTPFECWRTGFYDDNIFIEHLIKMKAANLYLNENNLQSLVSINNSCFQNVCEKEIANMKSEKIANVSFYKILTKNTYQLAIILENENVVQNLRSDDYKIKFPIYADMINNQFRKGKRKNELLKQVNKYSHKIFPQLPIEIIEKIIIYLNDEDLRILISACS